MHEKLWEDRKLDFHKSCLDHNKAHLLNDRSFDEAHVIEITEYHLWENVHRNENQH